MPEIEGAVAEVWHDNLAGQQHRRSNCAYAMKLGVTVPTPSACCALRPKADRPFPAKTGHYIPNDESLRRVETGHRMGCLV
jgi:hypothetical protein